MKGKLIGERLGKKKELKEWDMGRAPHRPFGHNVPLLLIMPTPSCLSAAEPATQSLSVL